jgi:hypothetical protein
VVETDDGGGDPDEVDQPDPWSTTTTTDAASLSPAGPPFRK